MTENDALRRHAEALAHDNATPSPEDIAALSPAAMRQTLHELRVHQIELEMQNEELRRTQLELDTVRVRYFDLYDLAPVGYCTLSEQGLILEANLTAATLLGVPRGALVQQPIARFIIPEDQARYYRLREQLFEPDTPTLPAKSCELRMVKQDGTTCWAHLEATLTQAADGALVIRVVLSDITARQQAAAEMESLALFPAENPNPVLRIRQDGKLLYANEAGVRLLPDWKLVTGEPAPHVLRQAVADALSGQSQELREIRQDGRVLSFSVAPVAKMGYANLYGRDVTDRKDAEAALRDAEWKFRALFENGPIGVAYHRMIYDEVGRPINYYCIDANAQYMELTGVDPRGKTVTQAFPGIEHDPFDWIGTFGHVARTGTPIRFEQYLQTNQRWYDGVGYQYKPDHFVAAFLEITGRKQAEAALHESEEKFRNLVRDMQVGVLLQGPQAEIRLSNPKALELLGINEDQLLGKTSFDPDWNVIHEDGSPFPGSTHPVPQAIATRHSVLNVVMGVYRPTTGDRVWLSVGAEPQLNAAGTVQQVICTFIDITDRKQAEEQLRQLSRAVEQSPASIVITDPTGAISYVNPKFSQLTGYTLAEALSQNPRILKSGHTSPAAYAGLWQTISAGQTWRGEFLNRKKNGELYWELASISPITNAAGRVTHYLAVKEDITDRKRTEAALRETNAYLENLINYANAPIIVWDPHFRITRFNHAFEFLTGRREAEVLGQSLEMLFPPALAENSMALIRQTSTGERWETVEIEIRSRDESVRTVLWNSATLFAPDGQTPIATIAQGQDITARKRAEEALRESNAELQTRNEELDAFAHTVAHDLKNPLGVMMGYAELLVADFGTMSTDTTQKSLAAIHRSGRKASNIIESLLLLASVRKQDMQVAPLDMAYLVDEVALRLAGSIQTSGADLHRPDRADWPIALGYAPWVEEIWANYLSNAIKYGGQPPHIALGAARQPDGFIRFSVRDNGPGLTLEQQARLFAPFERLGQARIKGHGLGLSVVRRIADKLGGFAGVDSQPGRGSTFYFTLPAA